MDNYLTQNLEHKHIMLAFLLFDILLLHLLLVQPNFINSNIITMQDIISTIADVCGILGFLISIYAANGVYKLKNQQNNKVNVSGTSIGRDFIGRDSR